MGNEKKGQKSQRRGSFKLQLSISMTLLVIAVIAITTGINVNNSIRILQVNLEQESFKVVEQIDYNIQTNIADLKGITSYFTQNKLIQEMAQTQEIEFIVMDEFAKLHATYPDLYNVYMATEDKHMYLYPDQTLPDGYDPTSRGWYTGAKSSKDLYVSQPYVDAGTGAVVYTVSAPIIDASGTFLGVFALDVSMNQLAESLNNISVGLTGYPILVDGDGLVLTHRETSYINEPFPVETLLNSMLTKPSGIETYSFEGQDQIAVYKKIDAINTYILASIPMSDLDGEINRAMLNSLLIAVLFIILSIIVSYTLALRATKPLVSIVKALTSIKSGDLTTEVKIRSNNEFGRLADDLNDTVVGLHQMIQDTKRIAETVETGSETLAREAKISRESADEVSRTSNEIALGATQQAEEAEAGARLTSVLAQGIEALTTETNAMKKLTDASKRSNDFGLESIRSLKTKSKENDAATLRVEQAITALDNKAKEIGNILDTITSIADQTNLLALNASIEAARAGEHGRGFAVVAEEIRKLAENSRGSTEEIQNIVISIKDESTQTVKVMNEVMLRNEEQGNAVEAVAKAFDEISNSIEDIIRMIDSVDNRMLNMNESKDQIVESINNISAISEETAAASEEVTATMETQNESVRNLAELSDKLKAMSDQLIKAFQKFKI